ncbi:9711_t:CDS:2 [Acaulospora morrowiae]|uniref:9711_t:CDS:1 n=1 Tax=Acaulospora morrowiae TaxID=94023 RepID=A0A9N9FUM0_9GLOM|nr:9711_t:CDS:2 [Acaulospora morrowiae]
MLIYFIFMPVMNFSDKNSLSRILFVVIVNLILFLSQANAWGDDGHKIVGQIAQSLLIPSAAKQVSELLKDPSFGGKLINASVWADEVKSNASSGFAYWSSPLHFINTHDDPGRSCFVDEALDCLDGMCIVTAIANYTEQLDCENNYDPATRDIALRFLAHFFGDITQPLHVCARQLGGNQLNVTFDGKAYNLHLLWDTVMVKKRLLDFSNNDTKYSNYLITQISNGTYTQQLSDWVACDNVPDSTLFGQKIKRSLATTECPFLWAKESNSINCPLVWEIPDSNPHEDLGGLYYNQSIPIIDKQLAIGGYRLANFLNKLLSKCC